jgi:hypothetical protein
VPSDAEVTQMPLSGFGDEAESTVRDRVPSALLPSSPPKGRSTAPPKGRTTAPPKIEKKK